MSSVMSDLPPDPAGVLSSGIMSPAVRLPSPNMSRVGDLEAIREKLSTELALANKVPECASCLCVACVRRMQFRSFAVIACYFACVYCVCVAFRSSFKVLIVCQFDFGNDVSICHASLLQLEMLW